LSPDDGLYLGIAAADITPPAGIAMGGYWGRLTGAAGVHDPLAARALTWRCGADRAGLVALDLVGLDAETVAGMRQRIAAQTGIPAGAVMVCCTHTHSGPLTFPYRGMGQLDPAYMERLQSTVADVVGQAVAAEGPGRLAYARVPVQIGVNRREWRDGRTVLGRNPDGPVVPYAHVVRCDLDGGRQAVLFSHACHGVVLGGANCLISADFAGAACRFVERATGAAALFVNGACGDINPRLTNADFDAVESLGAQLGAAVVDGLASAVRVRGCRVRAAAKTAALPLKPPPARWRAHATAAVARLKCLVRRRDPQAAPVQQAQRAWAQQMLAWACSPEPATRTQPLEVQAIAIGDLALLGLGGEIFARYQLELEAASPFPHTLLCGYANGCLGYVPTADEYPRGGYEIEQAYKVYPTVQALAPDSDSQVRAAALDALAAAAGPASEQ
jgi:neutral ceramidase